MGSLDQFALWQQLAVVALLFGLSTFALVWLLRKWNHSAETASTESGLSAPSPRGDSTGRSDAYAPMFRRIAPPSQAGPGPIPVTPETPRPSLTATTSPAPTAPVRKVSFSEPVPVASAPPLAVAAAPAPATFAAGPPNRPAPPAGIAGSRPGIMGQTQRAIKIIPRTGAPIGDISAKPVTASIGTRLSVLSLSVVDKPYAKPQIKRSEPPVAATQEVTGPDANTVRATVPNRVFARETAAENAGVGGTRPQAIRDMPSGTLTNREQAVATSAPIAGPTSAPIRPPTSRVISGGAAESDALSRFAAQMQRGAHDSPASSATSPIKPLVPAPRPMTATVPIVSPRLPAESNSATGVGPNTVQLTIGFEIASLQLTPALRLGAVQIRPTSNVVSVQLDASSQATLQKLLANSGGPIGSTPGFEIESLQLTAGGKIALITLAPRK